MGSDSRVCDIAVKVLAKYPGQEHLQKRTEILGRTFRLADGNLSKLTLALLERFPKSNDVFSRIEILKEWMNAAKKKYGKLHTADGDFVYSNEPLSGSDHWIINGCLFTAGQVYRWEADDGPGMIHPEHKGYLVELIRNPKGHEFLFLTDKGPDRIWCDNVDQSYVQHVL